MSVLMSKFKEVLLSVIPITAIVLILHFTVTPIPTDSLIRFFIGAVFILIGLAIFLFGVDLGISSLGTNIGETLSKANKVWIVVIAGLFLGFFVSIAEPDLEILARKVSEVTSNLIPYTELLILVSAGIGALIVVGFLRIVYNLSIRVVFLVIYGVVLLLCVIAPPVFLPISFDASGATTGALTVPFIMALALGVSNMKKDSVSSESDSFGLVGIASTGAIIGVLLLGSVSGQKEIAGAFFAHASNSEGVIAPFLHEISDLWFETLIAILPLAAIFVVFQLFAFKFRGRPLRRMIKGLVYTYIGLVIFLAGTGAGFMDVGSIIGQKIARLDSKAPAVLIGFAIGFVTILAEPAVHVLADQIEEVTSGYVRKRVVFGALTIGVGCAVALSIIRIVVPGMQLWHILLPGYALSLVLSFFVQKLFVGIAFDSGGVASGPMTATFILAFSQGVAGTVSGTDNITNAFGMIALVAMTPIITLQILGIVFKLASGRRLAAAAKAAGGQVSAVNETGGTDSIPEIGGADSIPEIGGDETDV